MKKESKEISIGERIRKIFDERDMNITQFAKLLHYKPQNVHNIFRRRKIDIDLLFKISKALNHDFVKESYTRHGLSKDIVVPKVSIVLEIDNIDNKTLKKLLEVIKQLEIKTIHQSTL